MNKADWLKRLKELSKVRNSYQFEIGDIVNYGIVTWGSDECFECLQKITGTDSTRNFYRRCAVVSQKYQASLRFETLSFSVYEALRHFSLEFLTRFLHEVKDSGRSCKQILHLAIEQFGSNPSPHKKRLKRQRVNLKMSVYLAALERAKADGKQVQFLIEQVLEQYLGAETVDAQKDAHGSTKSVGNESDDSQPRPTYAERRAARKAEKLAAKEAAAQQRRETAEANKAQREATRLAAEQKRLAKRAEESPKKRLFKMKLQWTPCHGKSYIESKDGELLPAGKSLRATRFDSEAEAEAVNEEFCRYYGYKEQVVYCDVCKAFHLKHVYAAQVVAAEIDLSKERREVRATVEDALQQHASQTSVSD